jgi:hypothetical protein
VLALQEPTNHKGSEITVFKVLGGIAAFSPCCMGFVFFVAVCGSEAAFILVPQAESGVGRGLVGSPSSSRPFATCLQSPRPRTVTVNLGMWLVELVLRTAVGVSVAGVLHRRHSRRSPGRSTR